MANKPRLTTRLLLRAPAWLLAGAALVSGGGRLLHARAPAHAETSASPEALRRLYGSPGGLYTAADIRANGGATPWERFREVAIHHDPLPQPGDRICPITLTKANPRLAWMIHGRRYLFCCPPCIDEFVRRAKEAPESIRPPEAYVKRP